MRPAFKVHVTTLAAGVLAVLGAIALGTAAPLAVAGACLLASGVSAFVGRRSLLVPRAARARMEGATEDERREVEQASGMMMGVLLGFFGTVALALGLWISLA